MKAGGFGRPAVLAALISCEPAALTAQRWQVDATGTRVQFDTTAFVNAASLAPGLEWQTSSVYALVGGSFTGFESGEWAVQGRADASLLTPLGGTSLRAELLGSAAATYHSSAFRTGGSRGELRLHLAGRFVGGWIGGVAATGWTSADRRFATGVGGTAALWGRYGQVRGAVAFTPLRIEDAWFPEMTGHTSARVGPVDLMGYAGWRDGDDGIDATAWGGGSVAWWVLPHAALTANGGTYQADLLQGLPGGEYIAAGLRLAARPPAVPSIRPMGRPVYGRDDRGGVLRFRLPQALRVALVGDWTEWEPVPLRRGPDGVWFLPVDLPPGVYRFNLIVNGDRWIVPEGVTAVDDGFGGETGLLIVPGRREP